MKLKILFINYNVSFPLSFELKLIEFDHQKYDENTLDRSVGPYTTRWLVYSGVSFMRVRLKFRVVRDALNLSVTWSFWTF